MKIRKFWADKKEIRRLERKIIDGSNIAEEMFLDLYNNVEDYPTDSLLLRKLHITSFYRNILNCALKYRACFWFERKFHPDYEKMKEKINLLKRLIDAEIKDRQEGRTENY